MAEETAGAAEALPACRVAPGVTIYLLRHGETIWNAERRLQGRQDSPLTLRGIEQARAVAARLAQVLPEPRLIPMVCSPLGRAWQTAVIVAQSLGLKATRIAREPRLAEIGYGTWEGRTRGEIEAAEPEAWAAHERDRWAFAAPGGESMSEVALRVADWLGALPAETEVIAVGHGLAGRVLRGLYRGDGPHGIIADEEPQDAFFRLAEGRVERFGAGAED